MKFYGKICWFIELKKKIKKVIITNIGLKGETHEFASKLDGLVLDQLIRHLV